jgi:hypothetical protein
MFVVSARLTNSPKSAMKTRPRGLRGVAAIGFTVLLLPMAATCARGSIPPSFLAQQQEIAVRVYCAHWRKTRRQQALEGEDVKRVVTDLEMLYATAFSACRSGNGQPCLDWLHALVQGLRHYGYSSLRAVCANSGPEDVLPLPGFNFDGDFFRPAL